jgi:uncharacterized protein YecA (UPF0149 family)
MQNDLTEKINSLGNDMIMGAAMAHTKEEDESVENLVDTLHQDAANAAVGNANIEDLAKAYMARPIHIKPLVKDAKIGRNDKCPCGSGRKYKNCCLASGKYETYSR